MDESLYQKIYNLIINNNVKKEDVLEEIGKTYKYIENLYFDYFEIDYNILYKIKDLLWYNIELTGKKIGLSNLKDIGCKFRIMNQIENNVILNNNDLINLNKELNYIINNWNPEWKLVELFSEDTNIWDKNFDVIIYNQNENPRKYNYYKKSKLMDENNKNLYLNKNVILCRIDGKLGDSYINNILNNNIIRLYEICKSCINNDKSLIIKGKN